MEKTARKRWASPWCEERVSGIQEGWRDEKAMGTRKKEVK